MIHSRVDSDDVPLRDNAVLRHMLHYSCKLTRIREENRVSRNQCPRANSSSGLPVHRA